MKRIMIVYKYIPQYRRSFFDQLRAKLAESSIDLILVYGHPTHTEALKKDAVYPAWGWYIPNWVASIGTQLKLVYQPVYRLSQECDLVIVEQANRLLVNPSLLVCSKLGLCKLAFWGHGMNYQKQESYLERKLKCFTAKEVDWWFAYNEKSATVVRSLGFPSQRMTWVMNTIDNRALAHNLLSLSEEELDEARHRLGLVNSHVCLYVGGMYDLKQLDFLLDACSVIHEKMPSFRMLFVGAGSDEDKIASFAEKCDWCLFLGARFEREKALYLRLAQLMLMPGLVGLAIIDSFVARVPIVTTDVACHSPEIEYLRSGENGLMVRGLDVSTYASTVVELLRNKSALARLRDGCANAAEMYSMELMVKRFTEGVHEALLQ